MHRYHNSFPLPLVLGALLAASCASPSLSEAKEEEMAQDWARSYERNERMLSDTLLEQHLTGIMVRLAEHAEKRPFRYRVRIVDSPTVNAFTPGGGFLYVTSGLLARLDSEAQVAMVIGHELSHITQRHVSEKLQDSLGYKVLSGVSFGVVDGVALGVGNNNNADLSNAASAIKDLAGSAMENGFERSQETEADRLGFELMMAAGYDPREAPETFARLRERHGDPDPVDNFFYGSHPLNTARYHYLNDLLAKANPDVENTKVNTSQFKKRTRRVVISAGIGDYYANRFGTAEAMFKKAAGVLSTDPVPFYFLGKIQLEAGEGAEAPARAIEYLESALAADPQHAESYRELGNAHYRKENYEASISSFERYLELSPKAADAPEIRQALIELKDE